MLANTRPSYGFPEFHSNDSPCIKTSTGYLRTILLPETGQIIFALLFHSVTVSAKRKIQFILQNKITGHSAGGERLLKLHGPSFCCRTTGDQLLICELRLSYRVWHHCTSVYAYHGLLFLSYGCLVISVKFITDNIPIILKTGNSLYHYTYNCRAITKCRTEFNIYNANVTQ